MGVNFRRYGLLYFSEWNINFPIFHRFAKSLLSIIFGSSTGDENHLRPCWGQHFEKNLNLKVTWFWSSCTPNSSDNVALLAMTIFCCFCFKLNISFWTNLRRKLQHLAPFCSIKYDNFWRPYAQDWMSSGFCMFIICRAGLTLITRSRTDCPGSLGHFYTLTTECNCVFQRRCRHCHAVMLTGNQISALAERPIAHCATRITFHFRLVDDTAGLEVFVRQVTISSVSISWFPLWYTRFLRKLRDRHNGTIMLTSPPE